MIGIRIGHGYDVHKLVPERKLILGGVEIPFHLPSWFPRSERIFLPGKNL